MSDIRKSLESLADSIEKLQKQNTPKKSEIKDRELSGNKIHGGMITQFSSTGISDDASHTVLKISDRGLYVKDAAIPNLQGDTKIKGSLHVEGTMQADKIHVNELTSDVKQTRQSPLEFSNNGSFAYGKGIMFTGESATKQLILQPKPDRFWSSEDLDLHRSKVYKIGNQTVLSANELGSDVVKSKLQQLGKLRNLTVQGDTELGNCVYVDSANTRVGIGTSDAVGNLTIQGENETFVVDNNTPSNFKIGTYTNTSLDIITDDTERIVISASGDIKIKEKLMFEKPVGVRVKNFQEDADLTVAGPIRFQGKKQQVLDELPDSGSYLKGDIVWNENPKPTGYIGWVCVRDGSPGEWKPFGQISG
jgi:hypothetical protein